MQIFIDTGLVEEVRDLASYGLIDGVTTNPTLIAKSGRKREDVIREMCELIDGPISAEVIATDFEGMIKEGAELSKIHENIVVKVPLIAAGIKATHWFTQNNIKTNVTLCFSANQALMAAKVGATYISPFVGRLDDISHDGMELIQEIRRIYDNYGFATQILAASIRHPIHFKDAALIGADVATCPAPVIKSLLNHPLTDIGLQKFLEDHKKSQGK